MAIATNIGSRQVGRSVGRLEGEAKVTGRAEYVHNLRLPGMLYGKIFRSTVAHGRIRSIDVSAARAFPGVHRVVTVDDVRNACRHRSTAPPSTISRSWLSTRCGSWVSRSRSCSQLTRMSRRRPRS
jgi:CO/xanthine dehydrogenase Mo-binding subunit